MKFSEKHSKFSILQLSVLHGKLICTLKQTVKEVFKDEIKCVSVQLRVIHEYPLKRILWSIIEKVIKTNIPQFRIFYTSCKLVISSCNQFKNFETRTRGKAYLVHSNFFLNLRSKISTYSTLNKYRNVRWDLKWRIYSQLKSQTRLTHFVYWTSEKKNSFYSQYQMRMVQNSLSSYKPIPS